MSKTTEYNIIAEAMVNGHKVKKTIPGFSSTSGFSDELSLDLAESELQKLYPSATIEMISAAIQSVEVSG